jgi:ABC-type antimicrobial peptide transport system permease subunit
MKESLGGAKGFFTFRLAAALAGTMGVLGLLMAVVGVYGVVSYKVTQRTREIGIRRALGASSKNIGRMIFGEGMQLVFSGVAVGTLGALLLTRLLVHMLVGVSVNDPLIYVSLSVLLAAVALLACYLPARRAIRVEPVEALRHE